LTRHPKGVAVTLFVNWLVKLFSMTLLAWSFMQHVFGACIRPDTALVWRIIECHCLQILKALACELPAATGLPLSRFSRRDLVLLHPPVDASWPNQVEI
jgi:hypothetical protein